jgi:DnaK suppressor protein
MTAVTNRIGAERGNTVTADLPSLRAQLLEQRRFRTEQLHDLSASAADRSALTSNDPRDDVADALRAGAISALSEIEAALTRVEIGRYGRCEMCECPIPLERLEILPMAALCMPCQHAHEARTR